MQSSLYRSRVAFSLFLRSGHPGRLPAYNLPFTVAFKKGAGVQVVSYFCGSCPPGRAHQPERYDGGIVVLLDPDVLRGVGCRWFYRPWRRGRALAAHDVGLAYSPSSRACIDQVVGPESVVNRGIVARRSVEEFF